MASAKSIRMAEHDYPSGFQVLCMSCNFAKGSKKMCPHVEGSSMNDNKESA